MAFCRLFFSSCQEVNGETSISNVRKCMNGMIFHQCQAQRYFLCFLWRLLKMVHRFDLHEGFWALPETARDSGLIFCWHMPQQNAENKVWAPKPVKKEGFWSHWAFLFLGTLLSWVFHWVIVHTVILTIVRLLQAWETLWASGEMSGTNSSENGEFCLLFHDVCES